MSYRLIFDISPDTTYADVQERYEALKAKYGPLSPDYDGAKFAEVEVAWHEYNDYIAHTIH